MNLFSQLLAIIVFLIFVSAILFVIFGQITVRKLRKNPETKDGLGFEYISGWDILNVAQALAMPRSLMRKLKDSSISALYSNVDILYKHTSKLDRALASVFYWLFLFSGLSGTLLVFMNMLGVF